MADTAASAPKPDAATKPEEGKEEGASTRKLWFPLESNPDVMNKYVQKLGFPTSEYCFHDVFSTEDWALAMVPRPVVAVLLLFPIKEAAEKHRKEEAERIAKEGQEVSKNLYYSRQTVGNACGTVALLHAVANNREKVKLPADGFWSRFIEKTLSMDPDARAQALEDDQEVEVAHESSAQEGQSEVVQSVDAHFICLTNVDGNLYELDGRKKSPVNHGKTSPDTLLEDAMAVVRQFMDRDPGEVNFAITALAPPAGE